jgi:hypothetical protein
MICGRRAVRLKSACTRGAGRSRRRARGDGVLVWSGVESPFPVFVVALVAGSRLSRKRERRRHFSSVARSLRLCVRNVVFVYEQQTSWLLLLLRDRPRLRPRPGHSSPLQVVSVQAALFRRVPGIFHGPAALAPHRSLAAVRVVPWYHWIGGRESWFFRSGLRK